MKPKRRGQRLWRPQTNISWRTILLLVAAAVAIPSFGVIVSAFSSKATRLATRIDPRSQQLVCCNYKPVIVVGKIIVDEYGDPFPNNGASNKHKPSGSTTTTINEEVALPKSVSIGGGGPQAAFGAASALAVFDQYYNKNEKNNDNNNNNLPAVFFVAPVGKDWTLSETKALKSCLGAPALVIVHNNTVVAEATTTTTNNDTNLDNLPVIETRLVRSNKRDSDPEKTKTTKTTTTNDDESGDSGFFTPRIRLWHDNDQVVHWYALNDSFGPNGADALWRKNPSAEDLVLLAEQACGDNNNVKNDGIVLHAIAETWTGASGGQLDFLPLVKDEILLQQHLSFVGIEPVASGETVTKEDAECAASVLRDALESIQKTPGSMVKSVFWCPDRDLDSAIREHGLYDAIDTGRAGPALSIATRDGPRGSVLEWSSESRIDDSSKQPAPTTTTTVVPAAALRTKDGDPVDPTGAGNAYSGAMTALLGNGVAPLLAACIASGVGAVVCEHQGLPPPGMWSSTLERIGAAAAEVEAKLAASAAAAAAAT